MEQIAEFIREHSDGALTGVSTPLIICMAIVASLIVLVAIYASVVSIILFIKYNKFNKTKNHLGLTGEQIARKILDNNGLNHIKVSATGSLLFGNSYSHYFKKVRLRRLTWKKDSVTSMAMASQKSSLAILDKEGDKDMKLRIKLTPFIYFGPLMFVPLVILGVFIDLLVFQLNNFLFTTIFSASGFLMYVISFVMSVMVLKTEKKAQQKALKLMKDEGLATDEEISMCEYLFKLYNIEYINDMIISFLEMLFRILQIFASAQNNASVNNNDND